MLNNKLSTLALASLFVVSASACEPGDSSGPDNGIQVNDNAAGESADADAKAESKDSKKSADKSDSKKKKKRSAGEMARDLADTDQNYCAFFVGECLHNTKLCKDNTDGSKCDASFEGCRDAMIVDACDVGKKLELKTEHALSCWNKFSSCALSGTSGQGDCSDQLTLCITSALDCDKDEGGCTAATWPKSEDKTDAWPAQGCTCAEENATRGYFKDKHGRLWYRDRYGRWYYRDRYGRWRLWSGGGGSGGSGGSWGGGGGSWGGGGGSWGGGGWGGG